jgi:ADP-heptose:LPS heptosyltransferase
MNNDENIDYPRFLMIIPGGIGDAVIIGLSMIDQIIKNDPEVSGKIDIVCTHVQADLFKHDPRIQKIIPVSSELFATPDVSTWRKGIFLTPEAKELLQLLRSRHYETVFPGSSTPIFYWQLGSHIMGMNPLKMLRDFWALRRGIEIPLSKMTRQIVNAYFGDILPGPAVGEEIQLYLNVQCIQKAMEEVERLKESSNISERAFQLLVVAPDTHSAVTRPPTHLLAAGIAATLTRKPHLVVYILPSYTDSNAAKNLYQALLPRFEHRVFTIPHEPRPSLQEIAALIDQADVFVTGDTGVMHLAVTAKKLREDSKFSPKNAVKIIALFGGTNPCLFGYSKQTLILGKGRKEQFTLIPGIFKEAYYRKKHDFFDHITPQQLMEAIMSQLEISPMDQLHEVANRE